MVWFGGLSTSRPTEVDGTIMPNHTTGEKQSQAVGGEAAPEKNTTREAGQENKREHHARN